MQGQGARAEPYSPNQRPAGTPNAERAGGSSQEGCWVDADADANHACLVLHAGLVLTHAHSTGCLRLTALKMWLIWLEPPSRGRNRGTRATQIRHQNHPNKNPPKKTAHFYPLSLVRLTFGSADHGTSDTESRAGRGQQAACRVEGVRGITFGSVDHGATAPCCDHRSAGTSPPYVQADS